MLTKIAKVFLLVAIVFYSAGCASIMSGTKQKIAVNSEPSGADIKIEPGDLTAKTPTVLTLKRKDGPYRLTISMPGYEPYEVYIKASTNGWIWGNILIGGIIGVAIDYSTGAAVRLDTKDIMANLKKSGTAMNDSKQGVYVFNRNGNLLASIHLE